LSMSSIYVPDLLRGHLPIGTPKLAFKLSLLVFCGHFFTLQALGNLNDITRRDKEKTCN
jgi:hypothetical protein